MLYLRYIASELRRRRGRTILTALGLGVGVGRVVTVTALSSGLDEAQSQVLEPLTGLAIVKTCRSPRRTAAPSRHGTRLAAGPCSAPGCPWSDLALRAAAVAKPRERGGERGLLCANSGSSASDFELVRILDEVVELLLAGLVAHVEEVAGADRRVGIAVVGRASRTSDSISSGAVGRRFGSRRAEAASGRRPATFGSGPRSRRSSARGRRCRRARRRSRRPDPRTADQQRHLARGLVGEQLAELDPVLAVEVAVVGGEDDVGVPELALRPQRVDDPRDLAIDLGQRLERPLVARVDPARAARRAAGGRAGSSGLSERSSSSKAGVRGAFVPSQAPASRGAGVLGACGALKPT